MGITTQIDGQYAIQYNGQNLNTLLKNYANDYPNLSAIDLLKTADRVDDSQEGTANALAVGDVIIIDKTKIRTLANPVEPQQPAAANTEEKEEPVFTEEKVTGAAFGVAAGLVACKVAAAAGAKIGGTVGAALGPLGAGVGIVAGAIIGGIVGWWIGDACN